MNTAYNIIPKYFQQFLLYIILFWGYSTIVEVQKEEKFKGKKVGVQLISINHLNLPKKQKSGTDTVCICISQSSTDAIYPYLQKSGFIVTPLDLNMTPKANMLEVIYNADSLKLDYILVGNGVIRFTGSSPFMEQLTVKIINVKTGETTVSGYFTGPSVSPTQAMARIGKKMAKKIH